MSKGINISDALNEWLGNGERGTSSEFIVQHLTGLRAPGRWGICAPSDPDDLRRCRLLLEAVPELAPRIGEMASASGVWAELVEIWDALCATMDSEAPGWRTGHGGNCPKTFRMMRDAETRGRLRDGWVQESPNCWHLPESARRAQ